MQRFKNILYLNEPTVDQSSAIERAVKLAEQNRAELTIIDVIPTQVVSAGIGLPTGGSISSGLRDFVVSERRKQLESMIRTYRKDVPIQLEFLIGRVFLETIRTILKNGFDLLIKPAENPSWTKRIFGSEDLHLLRKCPCPVWLIKPLKKTKYSSIMAAVDFDLVNPVPEEQKLNCEIMELAASFSLNNSASLHVVHVWEALAEETLVSFSGMSQRSVSQYVEQEHELHEKELIRLTDYLCGWIGEEMYDSLSPQLHLPKGSPKTLIAEMAANIQADLVVMGTVVQTGISGLIIGNTAEAILDQLSCSVLAIKPPGFTTPVSIES
jgi:nucleotide-binding universal stress UspA family protein